MVRYLIAGLSAAATLTLSGCGGADADPLTERTPASQSASTGSEHTPASDPTVAEPASRMFDVDAGLTRFADGTTILHATNLYGTRSTFRVYDPRWRPLTPVLELQGSLGLERDVGGQLIGSFTPAPPGQSNFGAAQHVLVDRDGSLTVLRNPPRPGGRSVATQPGDLRIDGGTGRLVFRPSDGAIYRTTRPEWDDPSRAWGRAAAGICALGRASRLGEATIHASVDEGRTFIHLSSAVLPPDSGPRIQACETAGDRVAVITGGEYARWLHVLDRTSGALLVSHFVGDQHGIYNPYDWHLLPNGKLVIGTYYRRNGLYVATDSGDKVLEFRSTPVAPAGDIRVIGHDIVLLRGTGQLYLSSDEGRTWRDVQLSD